MSRPAPIPDVAARDAIAPTGSLRAGINLSNSLLVTGVDSGGMPTGVSPSLARELAAAMAVSVDLVPLEGPGELVDALSANHLDIGNVGADPTREEEIAFSAPYCEIGATYLVPGDSVVTSVAEIDRPDVRIASKSRAAYTLWLDRNIRDAEVIHTDTVEGAAELFVAEHLEALAGLRPRLLEDLRRIGDGRVLEDGFTSVLQAVGTHRSRDASGLDYLNQFVAWAITSGLVGRLIREFDVEGLTVAASG